MEGISNGRHAIFLQYSARFKMLIVQYCICKVKLLLIKYIDNMTVETR